MMAFVRFATSSMLCVTSGVYHASPGAHMYGAVWLPCVRRHFRYACLPRWCGSPRRAHTICPRSACECSIVSGQPTKSHGPLAWCTVARTLRSHRCCAACGVRTGCESERGVLRSPPSSPQLYAVPARLQLLYPGAGRGDCRDMGGRRLSFATPFSCSIKLL
jgi:hypothetical protein